jgi:hypothetical protein
MNYWTTSVALRADALTRRIVVALVGAATAHDRGGRSDRGDDRGDVPGWVLVTLMTAGLVTALWAVARDRLTEVFDRAISSVVAP